MLTAILEIAKRSSTGISVPVIYASSAAVYGDNPSQPLDETFQPQPISAYGVDKLAGELHARVATEVHSVSTVSLRFFNVYGPLQNPSSPHAGVISKIIERIRARGEIVIYGDGWQTRDFVHVRDAISALVIALQYLKKSPRQSCAFNVCTGSRHIHQPAGPQYRRHI